MAKWKWGTGLVAVLAATVLTATVLTVLPGGHGRATAADQPTGPDLCASLAHEAGFEGEALVEAIAVGMVESDCRPDATHRDPENGQLDQGVWQITNLNGQIDPCLMNPACNAEETRALYKSQNNSWLPKWKASYGTARYNEKLPIARAAAAPYQVVTVGRIGVLTGGALQVKEGGVWATWWPEDVATSIKKFEIDGDRVAVLTNYNFLMVKEGPLNAPWSSQIGDVVDFHIAGNRIGVVQTGDRKKLLVKEGGLGAPWNDLIGDVKDFALTQTRVGVVQTSGEALVKEGGLGAGWVSQMPEGIARIKLSGNRIALLRTNKTLPVKEGSLNALWHEQNNDVVDFDITQNRVGIVQSSGNSMAKDGNLDEVWVAQMPGIAAIELSENWVGLLRTNDSFTAKQGTLWADWVEQQYNVVQADVTHYRR